jgi:hypothetical protein
MSHRILIEVSYSFQLLQRAANPSSMHCAKIQGYELYTAIFDKHKMLFPYHMESFEQRPQTEAHPVSIDVEEKNLHKAFYLYFQTAQQASH